MGKNKFINKKKSATFQLLARDSSDPNYASAVDHVFVRVDNNPLTIKGLSEEKQADDAVLEDDSNDIYADAPEDYDADEDTWYGSLGNVNKKEALPEDVRREIIEQGFPDDGYNYLIHLREIKNAGVGSLYYENPKATFDLKPDIKAYNASRIDIRKADEDCEEEEIYAVKSKAAYARVEKVVDDEIAALLDDDDLSRFGSDVEDLEEDFVVKANLPEGPVHLELNKKLVLEKKPSVGTGNSDFNVSGGLSSTVIDEKPRALRPLDEQFETLLLQEYGTDSEDGYEGGDADFDENEENLADKLNAAFKLHSVDGLELDAKCMDPSNILQSQKGKDVMEVEEPAPELIKRTKEYGEKYEIESEDENQVIFEESSGESEVWDCETIVSTYSNLDNHPGKIGAPETRRKKKLAERFSGALSSENNIISLGGKAKLPVDFLPRARSHSTENTGDVKAPKTEHKRKPHGQESKEEKKERKAAIKEEKREARRVKKEMKELYKGEAQRAQRVAASTGPSSIHLM